jgi:hypothetical protein
MLLKKPKTQDIVPTDYFLPEEFEKIIAATDRYEYGGGNDSKHRAQRMRALTLFMRWSGLVDASRVRALVFNFRAAIKALHKRATVAIQLV